jgi:guanylate kinase
MNKRDRPGGKLVIISAPSGAGKTTIVRHLLESGLNLAFSISATTRLKRETEREGIDYFFLTVAEFKKRIDGGEFVEWQEVYHDLYYGTLKSELERIWMEGNNVLFDVDVRGGINLKSIFGDRSLSIFIMPPSVEELEKRLMKRGTDSLEKVKMRIAKAEDELSLAGRFDKIIINDDLETAKKHTLDTVLSFLKSVKQ